MHLKSERNTGIYKDGRGKTRIAYQNSRCKYRFERNTIQMTKMPILEEREGLNLSYGDL